MAAPGVYSLVVIQPTLARNWMKEGKDVVVMKQEVVTGG